MAASNKPERQICTRDEFLARSAKMVILLKLNPQHQYIKLKDIFLKHKITFKEYLKEIKNLKNLRG